MRPDHLPARRPAARHGFTLVELLVVIIIVAVIAGLAIPAVMRAQNAARNAAIKSEIDQLHMAIMNYKSEYGSFPPAADSPAGAVGKHIARLFPRNSFNMGTAATNKYVAALQPGNAITAWLSGFTDDPTNPLGFLPNGDLDPSAKRKKLFDFDQSRVLNNTYYPAGKAGSPYIYIPSSQYLSAPYLAASPGTAGAFFVPEKPLKAKPAGATDAWYFTNTMAAAPASTGQQFFNADTFQILCAGRDEKFGTDDDLSNFWPGTRLDYIDSVK